MERQGDQTQRLPDYVLAAILGRLAPRGLATSRCVCKPWRDAIDARRMLRADLLPLSLAGFFINFNELRYSEFFSRPSPPSDYETEGPGIRGKMLVHSLMDGHCNGLLLFYHGVANPATGWWAPLPPPPPPKSPGMECFIDDACLAFDPTVSPHYQVLLLPRVPYIELDVDPDEEPMGVDEEPTDVEEEPMGVDVDPAQYELEWPPSSCVLRVFSSLTERWEERRFSRRGEAAGTVADWGADFMFSRSNPVYWHGVLYVHCQNGHVMRLSLSSSTYQVIKPPEGLEPESCDTLHHLGKSKKGVYYASITADPCRLQVWVLDESCEHSKWVLEHDRQFKLPPNHGQPVHGPWILQDVNYCKEEYIRINGDDGTPVVEENFEWSSDDEEKEEGDPKDMVDKFNGEMSILGFHPFKEIVFLGIDLSRGLAYHLNTSKIQDLGNLCPKHYHDITGPRGLISASFPYTPCWME